MTFASPVELPSSGVFAVYRGREYSFIVVDKDAVWLEMDRADYQSFPHEDVLEWRDPAAPTLGVVVPARVVSRFFSRGMRARWFGEPVSFWVVDEESVEIHYDRDPRLAELMGLKGNQYDGFKAVVPFSELTDVEVVVTERSVYGWYGLDAEEPETGDGE